MGRQTTGRIYKAKSGTYFVDYTHKGKRITRSLGTTKAGEAKSNAATLLAPFRAEGEVNRRKMAADSLASAGEQLAAAVVAANPATLAGLTVGKFHVKGKKIKPSKPSTIRANKSLLNQFVEFMTDEFPEVSMARDVTAVHAAAYCEHMDNAGLSAHTRNLRLDVAGKAFVAAKLPNPFQSTPRMAKSPETRDPLTIEQARRLCQDSVGEMKRLYALLLFTGLRVGDCVTLKWGALANGRLSRRTAKTDKPVAFPVHPELQAVLNEVDPSERLPDNYICPTLAAKYEKKPGYVPQMIIADMVAHGLDTSAKVEGRRRAVPKLGAHSFRHLFGRTMALANVPISAVQKWLGHSSPLITAIYSELTPTAVEGDMLRAMHLLVETTAAVDPEADLRKAIAEALTTASKSKLIQAAKLFGIDEKNLQKSR